MKKTLILLLIAITAASCGSSKIHDIGEVSIVSKRNYNKDLNYELLKSYASINEPLNKKKRIIKDLKFKTLDKAIDYTVKSVAGGEFLHNARFYMLTKGGTYYYFAEGDVWGISKNNNHLGFKVGDKVQYSTITGKRSGTITSLTDHKTCMVKDINGKIKEMEYYKLTKI